MFLYISCYMFMFECVLFDLIIENGKIILMLLMIKKNIDIKENI